MAEPSHPLCARLGLEPAARRARLQALGLSEEYWDAAQVLSEHLASHLDAVQREIDRAVREFDVVYHALVPRLRPDEVSTLIRSMLERLGHDIASEHYFEQALNIGMLFAKAQVPVHACSYLFAVMQQETCHILHDLHPAPSAGGSDPMSASDFERLCLRLFLLEMSLCLEAYALLGRSARRRASDRGVSPADSAQNQQEIPAPERGYALTILEQVVGQSASSTPISVVVAEVDRLGVINKTHGQSTGDEVLRRISIRMRSALRDEDSIGRYGGDEFMVLLRDTPLELAQEVAERLRLHVAQSPIRLRDEQIHATITLGVAAYQAGQGAETLFRSARKALRAAIAAGRNCIKSA